MELIVQAVELGVYEVIQIARRAVVSWMKKAAKATRTLECDRWRSGKAVGA